MNAPATPSASVPALLDRMATLSPKGIDLSLDRTLNLLARLGDPHLRLPPVVHIAGTNGKGSTLAMIRAGLEAMGQRVHTYTSPHLVRFNERIVLSGAQISDDALADALARTLQRNAGNEVTYFEATTCAAFLAYSEHPADTLLLEVGMGGRYDTTNVISEPRLTVITPVDMDHQAFLGDTIEEIAGEKAGILKQNVPCIVARQKPAAEKVIEERARRLSAPLMIHGQHWHVSREAGRTIFQDETGLLDLPRPVLHGPHQVDNAGTAVAALRMLGATDAACEAAVTQARWPARMQPLVSGPIPDLLPSGEVWLDGGHNPHAARAMAETLRSRSSDGRPLHLIFGLQGHRDPSATLSPFAGLADSLSAVPVPDAPGPQDPEESARAARALGLSATTAADVPAALSTLAETHPSARVLIFGSLYLAGAVLAAQEGAAS